MARTQRELWANLQHPQFGGPVFPVAVALEIADNTNADLPIFVAPRNVAVRRASVAHESSPDGTTTYALRNLTDSEDISSSDVDAAALAADTAATFSIGDNGDLIEEGDVIALEYESTGAVSPDSVIVVMELELVELKND